MKTAVAAHPLGAIALAAGLALSFTSVGRFAATIGFPIGLVALASARCRDPAVAFPDIIVDRCR